jgi:K+-transporting ATPase ATPase C chain
MLVHLRPAIVLIAILSLICGIAYPLLITGFAQLVAPGAATGSLARIEGKIVGSVLLGQNFAQDRYFWPRPSAAGADGYDPLSSGGSNLGPTSAKLIERVRADLTRFGATIVPVPADAVTASGSGLDPHISPANALAQAPRVARARNRPEPEIRAMIERIAEGREIGILGERRVNVLKLNLELDRAG